MFAEKTKKKLVKSAVSGAVLATAGVLVYGAGPVEFAGMSIHAGIPLFIAGSVSSLATDYIAEVGLFGQSAAGMKANDITATAINAGVAAGATASILYLTGIPRERLLMAAALGGVSEVASDYAYQKLFLNNKGMLVF
jgi:hypothetical protein